MYDRIRNDKMDEAETEFMSGAICMLPRKFSDEVQAMILRRSRLRTYGQRGRPRLGKLNGNVQPGCDCWSVSNMSKYSWSFGMTQIMTGSLLSQTASRH